MITRRAFTASSLAVLSTAGATLASAQVDISPAEARAIAKEAYIYGYPIVDAYRINHAFFMMPGNPEYKGPMNTLISLARLFTPDDTAVQTPNSDTPYSFFAADLRAQPIVLTVPEIEKERYYSIQLIDAYTQNFAYIGSRATGNDAGHFLIAGPGWTGATPPGIKAVIRSESDFITAIYRTQLFRPNDIDRVKSIQAGYRMQTLNEFLGQAPPAAPAQIDFIRPFAPFENKSSLEIFNVLNFMLTSFCPTVPSEVNLMAKFARIGLGPGRTFDAGALSPAQRAAVQQGVADAWAEFEAFKTSAIDAGRVTSGDMFGDRTYLKNNYLYRMAAAIVGIFGNSKAEAIYPIYTVDAQRVALDGSKHRYALRFPSGTLPPVHAFWSVTMYSVPEQLLVANPIHRYLINSPMLPELKRDAHGGLTIDIQNSSPGPAREANWLPAPDGPFFMVMRLYWPKDDALTGAWTAPELARVG